MVSLSRPAVPISTPPLRERTAPRWTNGLLLVALVGFVAPLAVAAVTGNLSIPHSDSWAYSRIAETFGRQGTLHLLDWNRTSLIGQILLVWPFAGSLALQQASVAVLALVALYCAYDLMADGLGTRRAILGTLLMAAWPGWASLSTSFLSDIPALAGTLGSLALGRRGLKADSRLLLGLSLLVGLWATSVREEALVAPLVVLGYAWITAGDRRHIGRSATAAGAAGLLLTAAAFGLWRNSLPRGDHATILTGPGDIHALYLYSAQCYFTLSAVLAPAILLSVRIRQWTRLAWALAGLAAVVCVSLVAAHKGLLIGEYLAGSGEYSSDMLGSRVVLDSPVMTAIELVGTLGGVLLAGELAQRWRSADPVLGAFTAVSALLIALVAAVGQGARDRYLLVLVPGVLATLLADDSAPAAEPGRAHRRRRPSLSPAAIRVGLAGTSLALLCAASAALAANGFSFDRASWRLGSRLTGAGWPSARIDAGFEWMGWHSPDGVLHRHVAPSPVYGWYTGYFSHREPCVVARTSRTPAADARRDRWTYLGRVGYRTFLMFGTSYLYVYRTHESGCPVHLETRLG